MNDIKTQAGESYRFISNLKANKDISSYFLRFINSDSKIFSSANLNTLSNMICGLNSNRPVEADLSYPSSFAHTIKIESSVDNANNYAKDLYSFIDLLVEVATKKKENKDIDIAEIDKKIKALNHYSPYKKLEYSDVLFLVEFFQSQSFTKNKSKNSIIINDEVKDNILSTNDLTGINSYYQISYPDTLAITSELYPNIKNYKNLCISYTFIEIFTFVFPFFKMFLSCAKINFDSSLDEITEGFRVLQLTKTISTEYDALESLYIFFYLTVIVYFITFEYTSQILKKGIAEKYLYADCYQPLSLLLYFNDMYTLLSSVKSVSSIKTFLQIFEWSRAPVFKVRSACNNAELNGYSLINGHLGFSINNKYTFVGFDFNEDSNKTISTNRIKYLSRNKGAISLFNMPIYLDFRKYITNTNVRHNPLYAYRNINSYGFYYTKKHSRPFSYLHDAFLKDSLLHPVLIPTKYPNIKTLIQDYKFEDLFISNNQEELDLYFKFNYLKKLYDLYNPEAMKETLTEKLFLSAIPKVDSTLVSELKLLSEEKTKDAALNVKWKNFIPLLLSTFDSDAMITESFAKNLDTSKYGSVVHFSFSTLIHHVDIMHKLIFLFVYYTETSPATSVDNFTNFYNQCLQWVKDAFEANKRRNYTNTREGRALRDYSIYVFEQYLTDLILTLDIPSFNPNENFMSSGFADQQDVRQHFAELQRYLPTFTIQNYYHLKSVVFLYRASSTIFNSIYRIRIPERTINTKADPDSAVEYKKFIDTIYFSSKISEAANKKEISFKISQVVNKEDLKKEGSYMHHCVGSYHSSCVKSHSLIFKIEPELDENDKTNKAHRSTIELRPTAITIDGVTFYDCYKFTESQNRSFYNGAVSAENKEAAKYLIKTLNNQYSPELRFISLFFNFMDSFIISRTEANELAVADIKDTENTSEETNNKKDN